MRRSSHHSVHTSTANVWMCSRLLEILLFHPYRNHCVCKAPRQENSVWSRWNSKEYQSKLHRKNVSYKIFMNIFCRACEVCVKICSTKQVTSNMYSNMEKSTSKSWPRYSNLVCECARDLMRGFDHGDEPEVWKGTHENVHVHFYSDNVFMALFDRKE